MKQIKHLLAAVFAFVSLVSFAQESKTSELTYDLFTTDVDNFMDVLEFSQVKPEKFFAFSEFTSNGLNFGFAKQFGSLYTGLYVDGQLPRFYSGTYVTEAGGKTYTATISGNGPSPSAATVNLGLGAGSSAYFPESILDKGTSEFSTVKMLFGFNRLGVSLAFSTNSSGSYQMTLADGDTFKSYTYKNRTMTGTLNAGTVISAEKYIWKPKLAVTYSHEASSTESIDFDGTKTQTTFSQSPQFTNLSASLVSVWEFISESALKQSLKLTLTGYNYFYPEVTRLVTDSSDPTLNSETSYKKSRLNLYFTPTYILKTSFGKGFELAGKVTLQSSFDRTFKDTEYLNGAPQANPTDSVLVTITPWIDLAARWRVVPEKLSLNFGSRFLFGNVLRYKYDSVLYTSADDSWTFFYSDFDCTLRTGLTFVLAKGIILDSSMEVFTVDNTGAHSSFDDFWNTSIKLQLSVKM